ncbi:MAG: hypothetical protein Ct9H300mP11_08570 [Chloroflexota bacterium]|nr:MAG: hypothetical protein Ct9H300mP11_08570 [Chloroflexota bacterium]
MGQKETGIFEGHPGLSSSPRIQFTSSSVGEGLITTAPDLSANPCSLLVGDIRRLPRMDLAFPKGVQFHKGYGEMTAEDVLYSYQQWHHGAKHARSGVMGEYFVVEGASVREGSDIKIIDDHTSGLTPEHHGFNKTYSNS